MCRKYTGQERAMRSGITDMILAIFGISAAVADILELNSASTEPGITEAEKTASGSYEKLDMPDSRIEWGILSILESGSSTLILLYFLMGISVVRFVMGLVLRKGARKRDHKMVTAWLFSSILLWIFQVAQLIIKLVIGTFVLWSTISSSLAILIRVVVMYIVYNFVKEIQEEKRPLLGL